MNAANQIMSFLKTALIFAAAALSAYGFFSFFMWLVTCVLMLLGVATGLFAAVVTSLAALFFGFLATFVFVMALGILTLFFGGAKKPGDKSDDNSVMDVGATPSAA